MTPILKRSKEAAKVLREKGGSKTNLKKPIGGSSSGGYGGGGGHRSDRFGSNRNSSSSFRSSRPPPMMGSRGGPPPQSSSSSLAHMNGNRSNTNKKMGYVGGRNINNSKFHNNRSPPSRDPSSLASSSSHAMMYHRMAMGMPPGVPGGLNGSAGVVGATASWADHYGSPAAAAEAYVADYMRTMHGQLPAMPYVPPPGYNTLSPYDAMIPPPRYYDALPLPEYPPPGNTAG